MKINEYAKSPAGVLPADTVAGHVYKGDSDCLYYLAARHERERFLVELESGFARPLHRMSGRFIEVVAEVVIR